MSSAHDTRHVPIDPTSAAWAEAARRLEELNFEEVKHLASRLGCRFTQAESTATKEDYINILDENYWDDFEREYGQILAERKTLS